MKNNMKMEIPKNTVIHCPTEELADKVLKTLISLNLKLQISKWRINRELTCYRISRKGNYVYSCDIDYYLKEGFKILSAEDFLKQYNKKEIKEIKVEVPEGMEVDLEKSIINEHEVSIVYKAIKKNENYFDVRPRNTTYTLTVRSKDEELTDNCSLSNQLNKIFAINQLQNIANYYNGDKEVNFNDESKKYFLYYYASDNEYRVQSTLLYNNGGVYFLNKQDAQSVIDNPNFREILDKIYK